jgi:signal transduction histidine kinase
MVHDLRATDSKIFSDKRRLQQILLNFVGNAIKFTNKGEIVITITKNREENMLDINVRDTGCGIPEEIKGKLFQMFATYDLNGGSNRHGVGLGLTIAKKLVFELGPSGEIAVES